MPEHLTGLRYQGAKSANTPSGIGRWVAARLPTDADLYCEPFAGMLGMLLQRPKAKGEAVNDLDGRIFTWWRAVRDSHEELRHLIANTPSSQLEHDRAKQDVDDTSLSDARRALAYTVLVLQTFGGGSGPDFAKRKWFPAMGEMSDTDWRLGIVDKLPRLAERIADVHLLNEDANEFMERWIDRPEALLYCDPPYGSTAGYYVDVDRERMTKILLRAKARVALSGYYDEWDHLNWRKEQRSSNSSIGAINMAKPARTESLWTNFTPPQAQFDFEACNG